MRMLLGAGIGALATLLIVGYLTIDDVISWCQTTWSHAQAAFA